MAAELGFELLINGSHHIVLKPGIPEIINIQPIGKSAKAYQVKQVRELIIRHKLWNIDGDKNDDDNEQPV